jgi:hypothetical protein
MVIVDEAETAVGGPVVLAPETEFALSLGINVPSLQEDTDTVMLLPDGEEGKKVQEAAVPAFSKSLAAIPDTDSVN